MNRLYHISRRFKGTGIYGFRGGTSSINYTAKLDKMVSNEVQRRIKRENRKKKQPLSLYFHNEQDLSNFNLTIMQNLKDLKKNPLLSDILSKHNVRFTKVQTSSTLLEVVIFWKMTDFKNSVKLMEVEQNLTAKAPFICEELNQSCNLVGKIPKIIFEQDKTMKAEQFLDVLQNLQYEDTTGSDHIVPEISVSCQEDSKKKFENNERLKADVLGFKRDTVLTQIIKAMDKASAPHRKS